MISKLAWAYPLVITLVRLCNCESYLRSPTFVSRILYYLPTISKVAVPNIYTRLPTAVLPYVKRAMTTYQLVGPQVKWIQTGAALEILHSLLGWVRSPLQTTLMQVFSRLFLVWGIVDKYPHVSDNVLLL